MSEPRPHPHQGERLIESGAPLDGAAAVGILIHGRGSSGSEIIRLAAHLSPEGTNGRIAWLAPQAAGNQWYPHRFLEPVERNEPFLSSALRVIDDLVDSAHAAGVPANQVVIGGFSQGACLGLEYAARGSRPVGGVIAFAGALIGAPDDARAPLPDLSGVPVFIGCGDMDAHIDIALAEGSAQTFRDAGAEVDFRRYGGLHHTIVEDELAAAKALMSRVVSASHPVP
ncbi:MAG: hypothetical protein AVDCRST_MAG87-2038 [uncultured Thermomicrobiales bacterium]|uniref:Phospholipase/carboxylesterase/thioesterase domain-containing protein n=1 Tax=uncultured Thermomicrobiales bacterium TaxID=1645740 RepID=A0A6J4V7Z4_9BACT|nr:MAG: hypothetical protein AVDCRST_MAG87-2038 [uncultured Thermomicrobiales bacterium]